MSRDFYILMLFKSNEKVGRGEERREDQKDRSQRQIRAELSRYRCTSAFLKESEGRDI